MHDPQRQSRPAPVQWAVLCGAALIALGLLGYLSTRGATPSLLFLIGVGLGVALFHAAFGFTGAYRRALLHKDISDIAAQCVMLALAMLLFAPVLASGRVLGHGVGGAIAPVSVSMASGAFLFGVGMQIAGGCASGTLYTSGGGNARMMVVLVFFCAGGFWASLHLPWWRALPGIGAVSLARELGWVPAIGIQLLALGALYAALRLAGARHGRSLWWQGGFSLKRLARGPWPLLAGALALALFNWATLLVAGHPWSITWGLTLWAAKLAAVLGWDPGSSPFWTGSFQQRALARPVLGDTTSIMNFGIIVGALAASSLAGKVRPRLDISPASLAGAAVGGVLLGYGARLAYGCNIGAFFSGVASTSLHGWVWIAAALAGNVLGLRLRPAFGLDR